MKTLSFAAAAVAALALSPQANAATGVGALSPGMLQITEVMPDPARVSDARGEWFELYNASGGAVDLNGLAVSSPNGARTERFTVNRSVEVAAGDWFVFGRNSNAAENGGLAVDWAWGSVLSLGNASDSLSLFTPGGTLLWTLGWYSSDPGHSLEARRAFGAEVLPSHLVSASSAVPYGLGDFGTPGAANEGPMRWVLPGGVSPAQPVPEPGTWATLGAGLGLLALWRQRRAPGSGGASPAALPART